MVFQEGKSMGVMSSYNRLGLMETAASYPLLTEVTREEWGFQGTVLSDMTHSGNGSVNFNCYENVNNRVLSGMNVNLDQRGFGNYIEADWDNDMGCPTFKYKGDYYPSYSWWYAVRKSVKEQMWMICRCGSMESLTGIAQNLNAESEYKLRVGQDANIAFSLADGNGELSIDETTPLPEGLMLDNGAIVGNPTQDCVVNIHVLVTNGSSVTGKTVKLIILPANGEAGGESPDGPDTPDPVKPSKGCAGGCGGSIGGTIALVGLLGFATAGAMRLSRKKKEDE